MFTSGLVVRTGDPISNQTAGMVMTHGIVVPRKERWVTEQPVFNKIAVCRTDQAHARAHTQSLHAQSFSADLWLILGH